MTTPCTLGDPELWFSESTASIAAAQALCASCPLRVQCLAGALERAEPWGVWGGELFEDGYILARKRTAGRPTTGDRRHADEAARALSSRLRGVSGELESRGLRVTVHAARPRSGDPRGRSARASAVRVACGAA